MDTKGALSENLPFEFRANPSKKYATLVTHQASDSRVFARYIYRIFIRFPLQSMHGVDRELE